MVEFAVALPLLLLICVAVLDFGRYVYAAIVLDNAVRVSAEYGATRQFTPYTAADWKSDVIARASDETSSIPSTDVSNVQVDVTATDSGNSLYRVKVTGDCNFNTVFDWPFLPKPVKIHRELSIRQYR